MHAPYSTPNTGVFLELGLLPISDVINVRRISFLHHILTLPDTDPVFQMYNEQRKLPYEKN